MDDLFVACTVVSLFCAAFRKIASCVRNNVIANKEV